MEGNGDGHHVPLHHVCLTHRMIHSMSPIISSFEDFVFRICRVLSCGAIPCPSLYAAPSLLSVRVDNLSLLSAPSEEESLVGRTPGTSKASGAISTPFGADEVGGTHRRVDDALRESQSPSEESAFFLTLLKVFHSNWLILQVIDCNVSFLHSTTFLGVECDSAVRG